MAPIIDRNLSGRMERRRLRAGVMSGAVVIACALSISTLLLLFGNCAEETRSPDAARPDPTIRVSYTFHQPILIDGDIQFTGTNGVKSGNGTDSNPFIIEGWDITTTHATGIEIRSTTAFFTIRDCYIHGASSGYNAIYLFRCVNGVLENNVCSGNFLGISVHSSGNNTLSNNTCSGSATYGIHVAFSSYNTLSNNSCSDNGYGSMNLDYSHNNTISGNDCHGRVWDDYDGISLSYSSGNVLSSNTCADHYWSGILVGEQCGNNILYNNSCSGGNFGIRLEDSERNFIVRNTCWGNYETGIMVWNSDLTVLTGNNCNDNIHGIFLGGSHNNTVSEGNFSGNWETGMYLFNSTGNALSQNNCSDNLYFGLFIRDSSNNTIFNNSCSRQAEYGVYVLSDLAVSSGNRIWNNSFYGNNGAGDVYDSAHMQARDDGTGNWWNSTEGYGNYWNDWRGPDLLPMDGIVDYPYRIDGSAGSRDYYPIAEYYGTEIPEFGMMPLVVTAFLGMAVLAGEMRRRARH